MTCGEVTVTCGEVSDDMRHRDPRRRVEYAGLKCQSRIGSADGIDAFGDEDRDHELGARPELATDEQHAACLNPPGSLRSRTCGAAAALGRRFLARGRRPRISTTTLAVQTLHRLRDFRVTIGASHLCLLLFDFRIFPLRGGVDATQRETRTGLRNQYTCNSYARTSVQAGLALSVRRMNTVV